MTWMDSARNRILDTVSASMARSRCPSALCILSRKEVEDVTPIRVQFKTDSARRKYDRLARAVPGFIPSQHGSVLSEYVDLLEQKEQILNCMVSAQTPQENHLYERTLERLQPAILDHRRALQL